MPRIQGVDIPADKPTHIALQYLQGVGATTALDLCKKAELDPRRRCKELTDEELVRLNGILDQDEYVIEGTLRRLTRQNIDRLKQIGCYRGVRHRKNLPLRGQRTKTNARTRKGSRKTVAGKKGVKDK